MRLMPFSIRYNTELNAIEIHFSGVVDATDIQTQMLESRAMAEANRTSFALANLTNAHLRVSVAFIYSLPDLFERIGGRRPVRFALINANQENDETISFYQLVSQNRGWNVEVFSNTEQAKTWLLG